MMSARRAPSWQPLRLTHPIRSAPPLLALGSFSASTYELQITDLTQVWYEKLSRVEILQRAAAENTSIDPSEAPANLTKLLEYLHRAITSSLPDVDMDIFTVAEAQDGHLADLRLKIHCPLPDGLDELTWTFELQHGTSVDFTNMFVLPMLSRENLLADRVDSLLDKVGEKDAVIERLVDHLEDQKTDAKVIVGHRRKKALEKFNKEDWEEEVRGIGEIRPMKVVEQVFGDGRDINAPLVRPFGEDADKWWMRLDDTPSIHSSMSQFRGASRSFSGTAALQMPGSQPRREVSEVDDDFDIFTAHKTPPRDSRYQESSAQKSSRWKSPPALEVKNQDISGAKDRLNAYPLPPRNAATDAGKRRIGTVGGKATMHLSRDNPPPAFQKNSLPSAPIDLTISDAGQETEDSETEPAPPPSKKVHLGTIGGKRTIGRIGGTTGIRAVSTPNAAVAGISPEGGPNDRFNLPPLQQPIASSVMTKSVSPVKVKQPSPDLDPDERADLRRKQIELELEAKRKAGMKKKRKF